MKANKDMSEQFLVVLFLVCVSLVNVVVHSQDVGQSGFISLDCGRIMRNASYNEPQTGITYISDEAFITGGESRSIAPEYKDELLEQVAYVRAFPEGIRNCYNINVTKNTRYLIRATFVYGNYDGLKKQPEFELYYGVNLWDTVAFDGMGTSTVKEIVHVVLEDIVRVCLVNTGFGTPFISALELRPLKNTTYGTPSGSLSLTFRADIGASINDSSYRYPYDAFDRMWLPYNNKLWTQVKSSGKVDIGKNYQPAPIIMSTAGTATDEDSPMLFGWTDPNPRTVYYIYMYFAELLRLKANETRGFNIMFNTELLYGPLFPAYLNQTTIYTPSGLTGGNFTFWIVKLENSTLPPIFNAIEVYTLVDLSQSETEQNDVNAITKIKSGYGVKRNWEADPCLPRDYMWTGLNCSYDGLEPPRITSLNLSSSGLTGEISSYISNLTLIESLDLSNNSLTGSVPDFLSRLPNLRVLNLERNKLKGSIPAELIEKSESGLLSLSVGENANLTCSTLISCANTLEETKKEEKKKNNVLVPIVASVAGTVVLLLITAVIIFTVLKRRNVRSQEENDPLASKKRHFTYSDVVRITNNFAKTLGKGGFGTVYHGKIDENTEVAVKVLTPPPVNAGQRSQTEEHDSTSGQTFFHQQFQAEVMLLMRVHHANLTSLVGYCSEGEKKALIYEYMANGDLESHILDNVNGNVLSWELRLQIAIDSAQGLEYLHTGCKPQIVHRDVKSTNILLNERFQAKIADFGLSRVLNDEDATHVLTKVAGTRGYLDPEYYSTGRLNDKSDVYSFGVVLLEIITGRPALSRNQERSHVSQWVNSMLSNGDIKSIVEPKLRGNFESNSVWKAVELAMACVSREPAKRPPMSQVVTELKDCLAAELSGRDDSRLTASPIDDSIELLSVNMNSELNPSVR